MNKKIDGGDLIFDQGKMTVETAEKAEAEQVGVHVPKNTKEILDAQEKVTLFIPRPEGDNSNGVFISINEVNYQIAFDTPVKVPRSVAQVWQDKKEADKKSAAYVAEQHRIEEELKRKTGDVL